MIQLFDRYGQESRDYMKSSAAGLSHAHGCDRARWLSPRWDSSPFYLLSRLSGKVFQIQVAVPEFGRLR